MKRFKTIQIDKEVCVGATCDKCGAEIEAAISGPDDQCHTFNGALCVEVSGSGYGEYMDFERPVKGMLCETCAREFLESYPFLKVPPEL
jgi:hypothetical protein